MKTTICLFNFSLIKLIVGILFFFSFHAACGQESLVLLSDSLHKTIAHKNQYVAAKNDQLNRIKSLLTEEIPLEKRYEINEKIQELYTKFQIDSAIHYANNNLKICQIIKNKKRLYSTLLQLSTLYSMAGMYRDAEAILKSIPKNRLDKQSKAIYYLTYQQFWEYYSTTLVSIQSCIQQQTAYRDSFLMTSLPDSRQYLIISASKYMPSQPKTSERILKELLATTEVGSAEHAIITCSLAMLYGQQKNAEKQKKYFMLSAISDMRNATRENFSLQSLALIYYNQHDIEKAFTYTQSAVEDAIQSGIQFRANQMYRFYSVINAAYQKQQVQTRNNMKSYMLILGIISTILIVLAITLCLQMKRNNRTKEKLAYSNSQLSALNENIQQAYDKLNQNNKALKESNFTKELFIAQFFNLCSNYIDKMEKNRNHLYKLTLNRKYDVLCKMLESSTYVEQELSALYEHFDHIFLNLYPDFVEKLNALLTEEERLHPKDNSLTYKELRIYALIKLGINDCNKIAKFLRCSTSTIYNYRTKMRNKAINRTDFEHQVLQL